MPGTLIGGSAMNLSSNCPHLDNMGLGILGSGNMVIKRKFRWTLEIKPKCNSLGSIPANFVKVAARPQLDIEETEINFLHSKTWIPGKAAWQAITVTYYDIAHKDIAPLWGWIRSVYDFMPAAAGGTPTYYMASRIEDYSADCWLTMYDGCGNALETWQLQYAWPQSIQFGDLDYSNSEEATIELTIRYSDAIYTPCGACAPVVPPGCCNPCA